MCAVSMVTDYYREKWPVMPDDWLKPFNAPITITKREWEHYQELKRRMQEYDANTGQPHCEKPDVEQWEECVIKFVKQGE